MKHTSLKAVDFFCSGGGMTYGLRQAGIKVLAGIDNDISCKETYETNNPGSKFVLADIQDLKTGGLRRMLGLKRNDKNLVLVGCSPCQYWSIIQTDKTRSKKSMNLLREFERFVLYFNPGYVLVENVPGILSKKDKSGLDEFIDILRRKGYVLRFGNVSLNEYGVPQSRRRFSLLATRLHSDPVFPKPDPRKRPKVQDFLGERNGFAKIGSGHRDNSNFNHTTAAISKKNILRLKKTRKNGGSRSDWADDPALKRDRYKGNEFPDNYGRMSWNKPAPTITTRFISITNGRFAHPEEHRGISVREGATLQTFPKGYVFPHKTLSVNARIIGNAVPPVFARRLAEAIVEVHNSRES